VAQKLRKLKHLRLLPVYDLVDKDIQGFFNSLPLMKELKSEALRWGSGGLRRGGDSREHQR
jgi:dynein heavy chain